MVIRANYPHDQFDANGDYATTRRGGCSPTTGRTSTTTASCGPTRTATASSTTPTGPDEHRRRAATSTSRKSEIEQGEYVRFMLPPPGRLEHLQVQVRDPAKRHGRRRLPRLPALDAEPGDPDQTHFKIRVDFYKNIDWAWVRDAARPRRQLPGEAQRPGGHAVRHVRGRDRGDERRASDESCRSPWPSPRQPRRTPTARLVGGARSSAAPTSRTRSRPALQQRLVFGANDWAWRSESGDWRFFYFDVPKAPPAGTLFLTDTTWDDPLRTRISTR